MIAEIICVGTELLMGQIVNTNAQFMAEKLAPLGVDLYRQQVVGDNPQRLTEAVLTALDRSDVVLFSGGLGPTEDDLTKETVAAALGLELVLYPEEWDRIVERFKGFGRKPAPNNKKQAMVPATCCTILPNPRGTAPGCLMEKDGKAAILMPGPPRELRPMFTDYVMPYLEQRSGHRLYTHMLRIFGKGESDVEYELKDLIDSQTNPTLATYCETGEVKLRITAQAKTDAEVRGRGLLRERRGAFGGVSSAAAGTGGHPLLRRKLHGGAPLLRFRGYGRQLRLFRGGGRDLRQRGEDGLSGREGRDVGTVHRRIGRMRPGDGRRHAEQGPHGLRPGHHGLRRPRRGKRGAGIRVVGRPGRGQGEGAPSYGGSEPDPAAGRPPRPGHAAPEALRKMSGLWYPLLQKPLYEMNRLWYTGSKKREGRYRYAG